MCCPDISTATPTATSGFQFPPINHFAIVFAPIMSTQKIPDAWAKWCTSGRHGVGSRKKKAVLKCLQSGHVRGYFSDIPLRPDLEGSHSMYPSFEHLVDPTNHQEAVVEARIFNDMKSHLSEVEFWQAIEHLFIVGVQKGKIKPPFGKRLPKGWSPEKHYTHKVPSLSQKASSPIVGSLKQP